MRTATEDTSDAIELALNSRGPEGTGRTFQELFDEVLLPAFDVLADRREALDREIEEIKKLETQVANIDGQIRQDVAGAKGVAGQSVTDATKEIVESGDRATVELGDMFDRSVKGLKSPSDTVVQDGRKQINEQEQGFLAAQEQVPANDLRHRREGARPDRLRRQLLDPRHGGGDHAADRRPAQGAARPR